MSVYLECITGDKESRIMVKDNITVCPVCLKKLEDYEMKMPLDYPSLKKSIWVYGHRKCYLKEMNDPKRWNFGK